MPLVTVGPLPSWMPVPTLLGDHGWSVQGGQATAELDRDTAADVAARLRGLAFDGLDLQVDVRPALKRPAVRAGRLRDARARRDTTPGFTRPGVRLDDDEGHRSLTPEALALALGERFVGRRVLDLTCGAGGNAIGFARAGCDVIAVELDAARLALARHNAGIYGVEGRIRFVHGDATEQIAHQTADLCFVDPPWGGWDKRRTTLRDLPLVQALLPDLLRHGHWALKAPPSFVAASLQTPVQVTPCFGRAPGDRHRIKFLLVEPATPG